MTRSTSRMIPLWGNFYPGAKFALDFIANRYRVGGGRYGVGAFASLPNLTVTRATPALSYDQAGTMAFGPNVPRIVPGFGLLVEESRTNLFLNSFAPATQNVTITAVSHTITVWGTGSVTIAAGTATISNAGVASAGSPRTIGCTVGGTISVTVTGSPSIVQVEAGAFGTSPIPTAGASVTRAADVVAFTGVTVPTAGTAIASMLGSPNAAGASPRIIGGSGAALLFSTNNALGTYNGTVTLTQSVVHVTGQREKSGVAWTAAGRTFSANGQSASTDANGIGTFTTLWIGCDNGVGQFYDGYIQTAVIYPTALSAAQLQSLTT